MGMLFLLGGLIAGLVEGVRVRDVGAVWQHMDVGKEDAVSDRHTDDQREEDPGDPAYPMATQSQHGDKNT